VKSVKHIQGDSFSVDPILINSTNSVYSRNHRVVLEIAPESELYTKAYVVIVGATCVDSIRLSHVGVFRAAPDLQKDPTLWDKNLIWRGPGTHINKGEELGAFHYGGSTVLTLLCPNTKTTASQKKRVHAFADINSTVHAIDSQQCDDCQSQCAAMCITELYTEVGVPIIRLV
jgi:phosphatidylserine decarboxylase precursor